MGRRGKHKSNAIIQQCEERIEKGLGYEMKVTEEPLGSGRKLPYNERSYAIASLVIKVVLISW